MTDLWQKLKKYLEEVRAETKKVTWPTREKTFKYTAIVIGISGFVALFLGGLDLLFTTLIQKFL